MKKRLYSAQERLLLSQRNSRAFEFQVELICSSQTKRRVINTVSGSSVAEGSEKFRKHIKCKKIHLPAVSRHSYDLCKDYRQLKYAIFT
jgi:hypothetical protein